MSAKNNTPPTTPPTKPVSSVPAAIPTPTPELTQDMRVVVDSVMDFVKAPQNLRVDETWITPIHGVTLKDVQRFLVPSSQPSCPPMPDGILEALSYDIRHFKTKEEVSDHFVFYIDPDDVPDMHHFWKLGLLRILRTFAGAEKARKGADIVQSIRNNLFGEDSFEQDENNACKEEDDDESEEEELKDRKHSHHRTSPPLDLSKSIQTIIYIFGSNERITGEETEPFFHRLQPILDQMSASQIPTDFRVTVLFSVLSDKARQAASKIRTADITLADFVNSLAQELLYDSNIKARKIDRWNNATYSDFRAKFQSNHEATTACIDHLTAHHKDLPPFMLVPQTLLARLRNVFRDETWCKTLFEKQIPNQSPSSFAELLKTAASNQDEYNRRNKASPSTGTYNVNSNPSMKNFNHLVAAFFAKTPPPSRYRRPYKYRRYQPSTNRTNWRSKLPSSVSKNKRERRCYGCKSPSHILRHCPERSKFVDRMNFLVNIGKAAVLMIEAADQDEYPDSDVDKLDTFLSLVDELDDSDTTEFDTWMCDLLDLVDSHTSHPSLPFFDPSFHGQSSYYSLHQLRNAISEMSVHNAYNILSHFLVDPGAPKSLCTTNWLQKTNWKPVLTIPAPASVRPFRFAGVGIAATSLAYLVATITDIHGKNHLLRPVVFVLPPTPIPFLLGLQTQRKHSFDLCLRADKGSHVKINSMQSTHHLVVNSHVWLPFDPKDRDPNSNFNWTHLISEALQFDDPTTNVSFMVDINPPILDTKNDSNVSPEQNEDSGDANPVEQTSSQNNTSSYTILPPWEQDGWKTKLTEENHTHLHNALRHPTKTSLLHLFRQQSAGRQVPASIKKGIYKDHDSCRPCAEEAELPRVPKVTFPPLATPNLAVTLDVMEHTVNSSKIKVLVMLDKGDQIVKLSQLQDDSARTAFHAYLYRWIAIFDAPYYTIVDRGTNLTNKYMSDHLRELDSQFCPIATESPWSIGTNERSHHFLHKEFDKMMLIPNFDFGQNNERLLAEVEMAWNFTQHTNRVLLHYNRFGIMPRVLGELQDTPTVRERISLMELARVETERLRAEHVINGILNSCRRQVLNLITFNVGQDVWFYRKKIGWRKGAVSKVDRPTIFVTFESKIFPTHENRVRPYFGELSLPPEIRTNDTDEYGYMDKPVAMNPSSNDTSYSHGRAPISQLMNASFVVRNVREKEMTDSRYFLKTDDDLIHLEAQSSNFSTIDSYHMWFVQSVCYVSPEVLSEFHIFLTTTEYIKSTKYLSPEHLSAFRRAKIEEIEFLLEEAVQEVIRSDINQDCEVQPVKWVLAIKRSPTQDPPLRYRARLVSASHLTELRYALNGTTPTISMSSLRVLLAIAPTWDVILRSKGDSICILVRDVTKAYLQSKPTERLVYYQPPKEFFDEYKSKSEYVWKAIVQIYGDVEAGKYWHQTFVPWLCGNILDYNQSIYDPSLLFSKTHFAATALCTDDTFTVIRKSQQEEEAKMADRFKCRESQEPPTEFKGLDIARENENIIVSQTAYAKKMEVSDDLEQATKVELSREIDTDDFKKLRSDAGKLAWLALGTSPLSAFQASVALQRNKSMTPKLTVLHDTRKKLKFIQDTHSNTQLCYVPLDIDTIHIRLYSDGSFQNLDTKHSQIGYIIGLADKEDNFNVIHWNSSRATRRAHSTEESELMALDLSLRCMENLRHIIFQLLKREVPIVSYIDCETLWKNLPKETPMSIPEIGYRVREKINLGIVASVCLLRGNANPADALTKQKPNKILEGVLNSNKCVTQCQAVFMLQDSPYRNLDWIPTMKVPMVKEPG